MGKFLAMFLVCGIVLMGSVSAGKAMTPEEYFDVDVFYPVTFAEGNHGDAFLGEGLEAMLKSDAGKKKLGELQEAGVAFLLIPGGRRGELDRVIYYLAENNEDHLIPSYLAAVLPSRDHKMPTHTQMIERAEEWLQKHKFPNLKTISQKMADAGWEEVSDRVYKAMEPSLKRIASKNQNMAYNSMAKKVGSNPTPDKVIAAAPYATMTVVRDKDGNYSVFFGYMKSDPVIYKD